MFLEYRYSLKPNNFPSSHAWAQLKYLHCLTWVSKDKDFFAQVLCRCVPFFSFYLTTNQYVVMRIRILGSWRERKLFLTQSLLRLPVKNYNL